jgi:hypothetical protein
MRLRGYTRVSTRKQAEEGHSLDAQEGLLRDWAERHDHELIAVMPDVMTSRRTDRLHARQASIRLIETGWADGLLILRWDRATRSLIDGQDTVAPQPEGGLADPRHERQVLAEHERQPDDEHGAGHRGGRARADQPSHQGGAGGRAGQGSLPWPATKGTRRHDSPHDQ